MFKIYDGRDYFYQWDLNRKLIVNDDSIKEVHFCNRTEDCSLVCEVYTENGINLVNVPNKLLQKWFAINVFAFDGESTKHSTIYKVLPRSKPADYVYTETEIKAWENYGERITELEEIIKALKDDIANIDVSDTLAEFKEKEIDYTKIYSYNAADLKNRKSVVSQNNIFRINTFKQNLNNYFEVVANFSLLIAYRNSVKDDINYYVNSPLKVSATSGGGLKFNNIKNLSDIGIIVEGETNSISKFLESIIDNEIFYNGEISFQTSSSGLEITLICRVTINTENESAANQLLSEFETLLNAYGDTFLLYYTNAPEKEIVEAQYIGGN